MNDLDQKIEHYEKVAVKVANEMKSDNLRAESSKEVISEFPNVRLASEKVKKEESREGRAILPSLLLSTIVGLGCYAAGYKNASKQPEAPAQQKVVISREGIEELIERDLAKRESFVFLGNNTRFVISYATQVLGKFPDCEQIEIFSKYLQGKVKPINGLNIYANVDSWNKKDILIYTKPEVKE